MKLDRSRAFATVFLVLGLSCDAPREPARDMLATEVPLYSTLNEEVIVRDFFQDRRGGFFVDVGCLTPIANSNTYYLEKHLGWSGIAVDALAAYAKAWEQARPKSKFFGYAVTDRSGQTVPFYRSRLASWSSLSKDWVMRFDLEPNPTELQVPTITLNKLLDDNGVTQIDFLSMDISGSEWAALEGFDLERFQPDLVCIVSPYTPIPEEKAILDERLLRYFTDRGYERIERYLPHDINNWFFTPRTTGGTS